MKIKLLAVGKTQRSDLSDWIDMYAKRIGRYVPFEWVTIRDAKKANKQSIEIIKNEEAKNILNNISSDDFLILLDEKGKVFTSLGFAHFIEQKALQSTKSLVFCIGGAHGFSKQIYERADAKVSFSAMTFPHQMIRIFAAEQLYRAMTIINKEPYHHA